MASHGETGALAGMDSEFGPIPSSFLSTQPVHMTYEVQDYARKEARHMPYIKINYLCSYFNPFSIIYGFAYLFMQLHLFLPVFSLHAFPFKNVELPLHITVFPDPLNNKSNIVQSS